MRYNDRHRDHHGKERGFHKEEPGIGTLPDTELWNAFRGGSRPAFDLIFRRNEERLFYYGMKVVADADLVWDTLQDMFLDLWNGKSGTGEVRVIRSYLYKTLRNRLIRNLSRQHKKRFLEEDLPGVPEHWHTHLQDRPEVPEDHSDREERVRQVLAILNRRQQELIYLRFYDGLSVDEIAAVTGIKRRTVYYDLSRGLEILKGLGKDVFLLVVFREFLHPKYRKRMS